MDKGKPDREQERDAPNGDAALETLFSKARARPEPSANDRRRVRAAVLSDWQAVASGRRWRRTAGMIAVAATVAAVVGLAVFRAGPTLSPPEPKEMARVEKLSGSARLVEGESSGAGLPLARGMPVTTGQTLTTGLRSGIALRLASGMSLRIDAQTKLDLVDAQSVRLETGRVYIDTHGVENEIGGDSGEPAHVAVLTRRGTVRHVGTQFMVRMGGEQLEVSVRSGSVRINAVDAPAVAPLDVPGGYALIVNDDGVSELAQSDVHGDQWRWAEELGAGFELDGRTMAEFLSWVGSETGQEIVYSSERARVVAEETQLHGQVDLPARDALDLVLLSSDLAAEVRDTAIEIHLKP
jgi:hypothetical protein